jgi:hypothetical protein
MITREKRKQYIKAGGTFCDGDSSKKPEPWLS